VGFVLSNLVTEAGVLHFFTPTRAWVLDGSFNLDRSVLSGNTFSGTDETSTSGEITALTGPRWYHAMSARVVRFAGFGISGTYARSHFAQNADNDLWSIGAYGELGMQYMFTHGLSLGWRGNLSATRTSEHATQQASSQSQRATMYHLGLQPVQIIGTFYF
jgi:hypothetical protein